MKKALQAKPLEGYRLWLKYADGTEGEICALTCSIYD